MAGQVGAAAAGQQAEGVIQAGSNLLDAQAAAGGPPPARSPAGCRPGGGRCCAASAALASVQCKARGDVLGSFDRTGGWLPPGQVPRMVVVVSNPAGPGKGSGRRLRPPPPGSRGWWPGCAAVGQARSSSCANLAAAPMTCSQLSSRIRACLGRRKSLRIWMFARPGDFAQTYRTHHRPWHQLAVGQRGQLHQPDPIREIRQGFLGHFERQAGLTRPARAGHRHQRVGAHQSQQLFDLRLAPDERGQRAGQVVADQGCDLLAAPIPELARQPHLGC